MQLCVSVSPLRAQSKGAQSAHRASPAPQHPALGFGKLQNTCADTPGPLCSHSVPQGSRRQPLALRWPSLLPGFPSLSFSPEKNPSGSLRRRKAGGSGCPAVTPALPAVRGVSRLTRAMSLWLSPAAVPLPPRASGLAPLGFSPQVSTQCPVQKRLCSPGTAGLWGTPRPCSSTLCPQSPPSPKEKLTPPAPLSFFWG